MELLSLLTIVLFAVYSKADNDQCADEDDCPAAVSMDTSLLGEAFNIYKTDMFATLTHGHVIFEKEAVEKCSRTVNVIGSRAKVDIYKNKQSVYKHIAAEGSLGASFSKFFTLQASLSAVASTTNWRYQSVMTSTVDIREPVSVVSFDTSCITDEFTGTFKNALKKLDETVNDPHLEKSWENYRHFLEKFGSHIISKVTLGARIQYYVTVEGDNSISDDVLGASACASVEGVIPGVAPISVEGCSKFTSQQREISQKVYSITRKFIRGGDGNIRHELMTGPMKPDIIQKFVFSAKDNQNPIQYTFVPIWYQFPPEMENQTKNFRAYYEGYLQHFCKYKKENGYVLEIFRNPHYGDSHTFECAIRTEGCHQDSDCHYSFPRAGCRCGGDTCVEYNEDTHRPSILNSPAGSIWDPVNLDCKRKFKGCKCINPNTGFKTTWPTFYYNDI